MLIDLNDVDLVYAENFFELYQLKSNRLVKEILMHKNRTGQNCLIISTSILNILKCNNSFIFPNPVSKFEQPLRKGTLCGIEVYLDTSLSPDTIILKWNKTDTRNDRIDYILNGVNPGEEIKITVLNY